MSLILRYKFNEPTASLTIDSSGNSNTLVNGGGVVSGSDSTYGSIAYFDGTGTSVLTLTNAPTSMIGTSPRTFSYWLKRDNQDIEIIHGQGLNGNDELRVQFQSGFRAFNNGTRHETGQTSDYAAGVWYHMVITYDGTTQVFYSNGNVVGTLSISSVNTASGEFIIGGSPAHVPNFTFTGSMSDFRVYSNGLSPADVATLYNGGPNPVAITPLLTTPGVASINVTVAETGASTYLIKVNESPSGTAYVAHTGISTGNFVIGNLTPETAYLVTLYAESGSGYEVVDSKTVDTLENTASNYDKNLFDDGGIYSLTTLNASGFSLLGDVINDVFDTGDRLKINLGARTSNVSFVKAGETGTTDDSILVPFNTSSGSGQVITIQLSDTSTTAVAFDETNNSLDVGGKIVQLGGSIVFDGKKLTVKDV